MRSQQGKGLLPVPAGLGCTPPFAFYILPFGDYTQLIAVRNLPERLLIARGLAYLLSLCLIE